MTSTATFAVYRPDGYTIQQNLPIPISIIAEHLFSDVYSAQVRPWNLRWFNSLDIGESARLQGADGFYAIITRTT